MKTLTDPTKALVLFSGGQDSATCLAWALDKYAYVETVGFDYGQRHIVELSARDAIRTYFQRMPQWKAKMGTDHRLSIPAFTEIGETAMTADLPIEIAANGLPTTFVPGRNIAFFVFAAALASRRGAGVLVGGMCGTDAAGYPDCRADTISAMAETIRLGIDPEIAVETPLIDLTKAETWSLAHRLGGDGLTAAIEELSHTCYKGERGVRHDWGYGCGRCFACIEREKGHSAWRATVVSG